MPLPPPHTHTHHHQQQQQLFFVGFFFFKFFILNSHYFYTCLLEYVRVGVCLGGRVTDIETTTTTKTLYHIILQNILTKHTQNIFFFAELYPNFLSCLLYSTNSTATTSTNTTTTMYYLYAKYLLTLTFIFIILFIM